jgi:methyl-accepting chemotaxis protein
MKPSKLSVRARLLFGFGVLVVLTLAVALLSWRAVGKSQDRFSRYVHEVAKRTALAGDVLNAANARAIAARDLVLVSTAADRIAEEELVIQAHRKLTDAVAKLKTSINQSSDADDRERSLFAAFEAVEARYAPVALNIVKLATTGQRDESIASMNADCRPLLVALLKGADEYIRHAEALGKAAVSEAESSAQASTRLLIAACAVAAAVALLLAWRITRSITQALGAEPAQLGEAAQRVASGDLSPVAGATSAPANSVLSHLAAMQVSLAQVVGQVRQASDSIATGSAQIAVGNADLSQRTEQQASNLQQTAASMEQMNATVKNNAETARQATQLASSASAVAEQGGQVVDEVVATMEDIATSSRRISDIIGVIDGIAFQTNILALNAAVEAARAGEQGRGFAVVAGEVRNLAQRSAESAREIKSLIGTSVEKVEAGTRQVGHAGTTMNDIVGQVKRVADMIAEISAATIEQTTGISQVSDAVAQLDQVTQQNAALVEESAAASESLKSQAANLASVVGRFRLDASETAAAR